MKSTSHVAAAAGLVATSAIPSVPNSRLRPAAVGRPVPLWGEDAERSVGWDAPP